jgi:hypothetical protein
MGETEPENQHMMVSNRIWELGRWSETVEVWETRVENPARARAWMFAFEGFQSS